MGSLNFRTNDQAFAEEKVEKKLADAKIRLVLENRTFYKLLFS